MAFQCSVCGVLQPKWFGKCPQCGQWNTATESVDPTKKKSKMHVYSLQDKTDSSEQVIKTNIRELDRVLGEGMSKGSSILCGGPPGIGKSTLMLQLASAAKIKTLYVTGEETLSRIKQRAIRLNVHKDSFLISMDTLLPLIITACEEKKPELLIVDSIQTIHDEELNGSAGSVGQIRHCTHRLIETCRTLSIILILVAHVTKEGEIAGPKILEHLVDIVLFFDQGDMDLRFLRSSKNRFGTTHEVGLFIMDAHGLQAVQDPSVFFLVRRKGPPPAGVISVPIYEGSRVFMVEIQSLIVPASSLSRIYSDRIDPRRVSRMAAVLEKYLDITLSNKDIYINVAGGITIQDIGVDVGICLALYSAYQSVPVPEKTTAFGEISLAGEIRPTAFTKQRMHTAKDMGFLTCIVPSDLDTTHTSASSLTELIHIAFSSPHTAKK